jgi:hypothetical protein
VYTFAGEYSFKSEISVFLELIRSFSKKMSDFLLTKGDPCHTINLTKEREEKTVGQLNPSKKDY